MLYRLDNEFDLELRDERVRSDLSRDFHWIIPYVWALLTLRVLSAKKRHNLISGYWKKQPAKSNSCQAFIHSQRPIPEWARCGATTIRRRHLVVRPFFAEFVAGHLFAETFRPETICRRASLFSFCVSFVVTQMVGHLGVEIETFPSPSILIKWDFSSPTIEKLGFHPQKMFWVGERIGGSKIVGWHQEKIRLFFWGQAPFPSKTIIWCASHGKRICDLKFSHGASTALQIWNWLFLQCTLPNHKFL